MFKVDEDNTIHLTRGDTARFSIGRIVNTVTNTNYTPTAEDTVTMTVKKTVLQADPCVQIIVPGGGGSAHQAGGHKGDGIRKVCIRRTAHNGGRGRLHHHSADDF